MKLMLSLIDHPKTKLKEISWTRNLSVRTTNLLGEIYMCYDFFVSGERHLNFYWFSELQEATHIESILASIMVAYRKEMM